MSYNLSALSFFTKRNSGRDKKIIPAFKINYKIDHRQAIADSWPKVLMIVWLEMIGIGNLNMI